MSSGYILSIDLGSSSIKTAVVDAGGRIDGTGVRSIRTLQTGPKAAEQDPAEIWEALREACAHALRESRARPRDVVAITCASQYFSVVPVDRTGNHVGNLIMWLDERGGPFCQEMYERHPEAMGRWLSTTGFLPIPSGSDSVSHTLHLKNSEPEVYERAAFFLEPADFIVARLTERCTTNPCTGFAQLLIDNRDPASPRYDEELAAIAGLDLDKLPPIEKVGETVGRLSPTAAEDLGLETSTLVFTGLNDTQAVSVGTGAEKRGRAGINVGTTCQVLGFLDTLRTDPGNNLFAMPSPLPGRYNIMAENGLGGRLVQHFLENIVFHRDALSSHAPENPYAGMAAALEAEPPGAGGVLYLPWLAGSNTPEPSSAMRGGFLNVSLETTRCSMLRAVVEGITFNLFWQLGYAETLLGSPIEYLRFAGGGAQQDPWAQTVADIMNRPVEQMAEPRHINNRATAFLAFEKLGRVSFDDADRFFPVRRAFEPRAELRGIYDRLFEQYRAAFHQTRPIAEALNPE